MEPECVLQIKDEPPDSDDEPYLSIEPEVEMKVGDNVIKQELDDEASPKVESVFIKEELNDNRFMSEGTAIASADERTGADDDPDYNGTESEQSDKAMYHCRKCGKTFTLRGSLRKHNKQVHPSMKPFQCEHCPESFSTYYKLKLHLNQHTERLPFVCKYCDLSFNVASELFVHSREHVNDPNPIYECPECKALFKEYKILVKHKAQHRTKAMYVCKHCGESYLSELDLNSHISSKHTKLAAPTSNTPFICKYCSSSFLKATELLKHCQESHELDLNSKRKRQHACGVCGDKFHYQKDFLRHVRSHRPTNFKKSKTRDKPMTLPYTPREFRCNKCLDAFPTNISLKAHECLSSDSS